MNFYLLEAILNIAHTYLSKYYGYAFAACIEHTKLEHLKFHRSSSSTQICAAMDLCVAADFCGQSKREPVTPKPEPVTPKFVEPVTPEPVKQEFKEPEPVTPKPEPVEPKKPEPVTPEPVTPKFVEPVTPEPVEQKPIEPEPKEPVTPKESELVTPKPLELVTPKLLKPVTPKQVESEPVTSESKLKILKPGDVQFELKPKPFRLNSGEEFDETPIKVIKHFFPIDQPIYINI